MIFNNHERERFDDPRLRQWIFGLMWFGSAVVTAGVLYGVYALG